MIWKWLRMDAPVFAADHEACEDLAGELSTVRYGPDSSGLLVIESKDSLKSRGLRSCDLADALGVTFAPAASMVALGLTVREIEEAWREGGHTIPTQHEFKPRRIWGGRRVLVMRREHQCDGVSCGSGETIGPERKGHPGRRYVTHAWRGR